MTYDIKHLNEVIKSEDLKRLFEMSDEQREKTEQGKKVKALIDLHANRIDDGVRRSLSRARVAYAVEEAIDAPRNQISFTLVRGLISKNPGQEELQSIAKSWGLDTMLVPWRNESGQELDMHGNILRDQNSQKPGYKLNLPTFYNILLPMALSYARIRWAKLAGDRDVFPLLKYEPARLSHKDQALCRVITARGQRMATDMGYREDMRQAIWASLLHSACIQFPLEPYHIEKQVIGGKEKVVKEGVRWFRPHWTKVFFDQTHPLHTLNSDTGCEYVGYWSLQRWGEVNRNENYWNREKVGIGDAGWRGDNLWSFYQEIYPCVMKFPNFNAQNENDRETKAFLYSTNGDEDSAVDITVMFHKLVPKEWGLGEYNHPVWMRFVYAGDRTCIFAEPIAYTPGVAWMYDFDENRENNSSLALELIPFQDHLGNLISQYLLTVKKNLLRIVAVDTDIVGQDFLAKAALHAENALRGVDFLTYSGKALKRGQQDVREAFQSLSLQPQQANELIGAINTILGIMERVLGFSPAEVGSQATHQQSATETSIVAANTSVRMGHTSAGYDSAIHAWKKAIYQAFLAYGSDEVTVQVAELHPDGIQALKDAGFEVEEGPEATYGVSGPKGALLVEEFSTERDGANRINESNAAQLMLTVVDRLMVPQFMETVGVDTLLEMLREVATMFGIPSDFISRIKAKVPKGPGQNPEETVNQIRQVVQAELVPFSEQIRANVVEPLGKVQQQVAVSTQALSQVAQAQQQDRQAIVDTRGLLDAVAGAVDGFIKAQTGQLPQ